MYLKFIKRDKNWDYDVFKFESVGIIKWIVCHL